MNPIPLTSAQKTILKQLARITARFDPCGITVKNGVARCRGISNNHTPCCTGCKYLTSTGCSVVSAGCRFYFCDSAWDGMSPLVRNAIKKLAALWGKAPIRQRYDQHVFGHLPPFVWSRGAWGPRHV